MRPGETALLWIETPGNPTLAVTDIAAVAEIAHAAGARLAVDSTVATPVFTRPLDLGAVDIRILGAVPAVELPDGLRHLRAAHASARRLVRTA